MSTPIGELLEQIAPEHSIEPIRSAIDDAINAFGIGDPAGIDRDQFKRLMIEFVCHIDGHLAGAGGPRPSIEVYDHALCIEVLDKLYGPNGFRMAHDRVTGGYAGGLSSVLREFAGECVERVSGKRIAEAVSGFCWQMSWEDRHAVAQEYVARFGQLVLPEWREKDGAGVAANLQDVLKRHPANLLRFRRLGR